MKNDICSQTLMNIIQDAAIVVSEQNLHINEFKRNINIRTMLQPLSDLWPGHKEG